MSSAARTQRPSLWSMTGNPLNPHRRGSSKVDMWLLTVMRGTLGGRDWTRRMRVSALCMKVELKREAKAFAKPPTAVKTIFLGIPPIWFAFPAHSIFLLLTSHAFQNFLLNFPSTRACNIFPIENKGILKSINDSHCNIIFLHEASSKADLRNNKILHKFFPHKSIAHCYLQLGNTFYFTNFKLKQTLNSSYSILLFV